MMGVCWLISYSQQIGQANVNALFFGFFDGGEVVKSIKFSFKFVFGGKLHFKLYMVPGIKS